VRIAETVEQPFSLADAYLGLGVLHLRQGDLLQAIAILEKALAVCQTGDILMLLPDVTRALGYAYALSGRFAEALPLLEQAMKQGGSHQVSSYLSEAYLLLGCCILADASRPLSCDDRLLLGKHIGKDIFRSLPKLEALVGIQDQGLDECLRLLATRFPNGFDGQAPFRQ